MSQYIPNNDTNTFDKNLKTCSGSDSTQCELNLAAISGNPLMGVIRRDRDEPAKHLKQLPRNPSTFDTRFELFTSSLSYPGPIILDYLNETRIKHQLSNHTFDKIYIVTHGFRQGVQGNQYMKLKNGLLTVRSFENNQIGEPLQDSPAVIMVEWKGGSKQSNNPTKYYSRAAVTTMVVGRQIALLCHYLVKSGKISAKDIHLIGFSLGGQVMHFAGEHFKTINRSKVGRITGLDPAGQHFEGHAHLSKADADFVDVIHTATMSMASSFVSNGYLGQFGMFSSIGHVDFYPNNGINQPQCKVGVANSCSHQAAIHYFADSLMNDVEIRRKLIVTHSTEYFEKPISMGIDSIKSYDRYNYDETDHVRLFFPYESNHRHKRQSHDVNDICLRFQTTCDVNGLKNAKIKPISYEPGLTTDGQALALTKAYVRCWKPQEHPHMVCSTDGKWTTGVPCPPDRRLLVYGLCALVVLLIVSTFVLLPMTIVRKRRRKRQADITNDGKINLETIEQQEPL